MTLVAKSLDAVSVAGPGTAIMFDKPLSRVSIQSIVVGAPTISLQLEGTIDGSNWVNLGANDPGSITGSYRFAGMPPVMGIRANLTSISGGTSPTVTAWVAAEEP
jgi:hypothetical protein